MIDKMTKAQLIEMIVRTGGARPNSKTLRAALVHLAHYRFEQAHAEALAENEARTPVAASNCTTCGRAVRIGAGGPEHVEPSTHVNGIHAPTTLDEAAPGEADDLQDDAPSRPLSHDVAAAAERGHSTRLVTGIHPDGASYWMHVGTDVRLDTEPDGTYTVRVPQMDAPGHAVYADRVPTFVKARRHAGNAVALVREQVDAAHLDARIEANRRLSDRAAGITLAPSVPASPSETERIVRRAGYDVLRAVAGHVDGWIETAKENHEAMGRRDVPDTWLSEGDFHRILADTARELGIGEQWEAGRS